MATRGKMGPPRKEEGHLPHSVPGSARAPPPRTPALPLGASEMPASVCPVPGSRRQMDVVITRAGGGGRESEWPLLAGVLHSVFCWLHPRTQGARGCSGHNHAPAFPHPASCTPSVAGDPSPVPWRCSCSSLSCALLLSPTGSSAGCLPSGHHYQLSRNQKPHKQKITKPKANQ